MTILKEEKEHFREGQALINFGDPMKERKKSQEKSFIRRKSLKKGVAGNSGKVCKQKTKKVSALKEQADMIVCNHHHHVKLK